MTATTNRGTRIKFGFRNIPKNSIAMQNNKNINMEADKKSVRMASKNHKIKMEI